MIVKRNLEPDLRRAAGQCPVLTITGPRQSGKSTLVKAVFPNHDYANLESLDTRTFAREDPRGFLNQFRGGVIVDEVQNVPELLSYIQVVVDDNPVRGRWILTGSQNFALSKQVSQSLAGRTSLHQLLPLGWDEVKRFPQHLKDLEQVLYTGGYPRIFDEGCNPTGWLDDYITTYLERDVRLIVNLGNPAAFHRFVQVCAGCSGALLNYSALAADCGISQSTAKRWVSVLETSYILVCIYSFRGNPRKRLSKMPKLYFLDSGLMCYLLGIREPEQVLLHPLRGQIFETWVVSEIMKRRFKLGVHDRLNFYRDHNGIEVDLVIPGMEKIMLIEAKPASTPSSSLFRRVRRVKKHLQHLPQSINAFVVYGGDRFQQLKDGAFIPWQELKLLWQSPSSSRLDDKRVEVTVTTESLPVSGVEVLAFFPNKTWVAGKTDRYGAARLKLHSVDQKMKVYAASAGFAACLETDWMPQEGTLRMEMHPLSNGGSDIFRKGTGEIPNLSGQLNPILDAQQRTCLSADNIAINDGRQQPVSFELGETMHLLDALGNERCIRIINITGRAVLLEYEPLTQKRSSWPDHAY